MDKIVGTTEAAFLLNISVSRVKVLLQQERIKGAKKEGRVWKIPLIKGIPQVKQCKHGLKGTWRRRRCNKTTRIHVNKSKISQNRHQKSFEPVIIVRQGSRQTYCHLAEVKGSCRVVYQPDNALCSGAVVWIEVLPDTVVIPQLFTAVKVEVC